MRNKARITVLRSAVVFFVFTLFASLEVSAQTLALEKYSGQFFTIDKPKGWEIITAGSCSDFSFLLRDRSNPLRQVFFFGEVGPVYMTLSQKQLDQQYVAMGGYPSPWLDMPVVDPLTPSNFFMQWHLIARSQAAQSFMPQCPRLDGFKVISSKKAQSHLQGGKTEVVRALFQQSGKVAQGMFMATVVQVMPFTGGPGGGIAYGMMVAGIAAPKEEFPKLENSLLKVIRSFNMSQSHANLCMQQQAATYGAILKAGKTLSETSDIIADGWNNRSKTHDVIAEKTSDQILGKERLYNPDTGEVYEFENGFYDKYNINRENYKMNNLQMIPDNNYDLWMQATKDGARNIR